MKEKPERKGVRRGEIGDNGTGDVFALAPIELFGTGVHYSPVPAIKMLVLLRPNLLPMMASPRGAEWC